MATSDARQAIPETGSPPDSSAPPPAPALAGEIPGRPAPITPRRGPPDPADAGGDSTRFWLYAAHLFTVFGIALSNLLLTTSLVLALGRRSQLVQGVRRAPALSAALGLYVLLFVVAVVFSFDPGRSFGALSEVYNVSGLVLALAFVRGERDVRRIVVGLVTLGAVVSVAGLAQMLFGYGGIDQRIRGPFSHYMTFAGFLLVVDLLLVATMLQRPSWRRPWHWAILAVVNFALLASLTRSAWVGLGVALTLLVVLRAPRWLLAYVPAAVLLVLLAPVSVLQRVGSITDLADRSNYDRLCMARAGLSMIAERPLTGLGPDLVEPLYPIYRPPSAPRYQVPHLHNTFLQIAAERGLPSLAVYLALMGLPLAVAWRRFRREGGWSGPRAELYLGVVLALVAFNVAGLFEDNWGDTEVQRPVLFLMALPFCLGAAGERAGDARGEHEPLPDGWYPGADGVLRGTSLASLSSGWPMWRLFARPGANLDRSGPCVSTSSSSTRASSRAGRRRSAR